MTRIQLKEPPARPAQGRRPLMALDRRIMEIAQEAMRPVAVTRALRAEDQWSGIRTQRVAARLKALVNRGLMIRIRPTGGPPNGPGTSLYRVKKDGDEQTDG